jgi:hypothetical protein
MTKTDLRNWVLRKLGPAEMHKEIDTEQIDDRIEEALHKFNTYHYDGSDIAYITMSMTIGVNAYTLPDTVVDVLNVVHNASVYSGGGEAIFFENDMRDRYNSLYSNGFSIVSIETYRQQAKNYENYMTMKTMFEWNETTHSLTLFETPDETKSLFLECYVKESDESKYYTNVWFKSYLAALCKLQWADNISKYDGAILPGGITLNWQKLLDDAKTEIEKLELELTENFQTPVDFMQG